MTKVKISAEGMLEIIKGIFQDNDIDILNNDAKLRFNANTIQEALNIEYYTFKHRPASTEQIIEAIIENGETANLLAGVERSFCCFTMNSVERVFTKDVDQAVVEGTLDFWVQTSKLQMVEYLLDNANRALTGVRIPVTFQPCGEVRKASVIFDTIGEPELDLESQIGEAARISVGIMIALNPDVVSYSDYTVSVSFIDNDGKSNTDTVPLSSLSFVNTMTQKAVPYVKDTRKVGSINLSGAIAFVLVFEGYNTPFVNYITNKALSSALVQVENTDNNQSFMLTITRAKVSHTHEVVIKDHQVIVGADTSNETHTLSLVTRGI